MKLVRYGVAPLVAVAALAYLGHYFYIVDGQVDVLRLCLAVGIPFGIPYMIFVIPVGGNPSTSVTILVLNIILGAIFGCLLAAIAVIRAIATIARCTVNCFRAE